MATVSLDELDWLHDATVTRVVCDSSNHNERSLIVELLCDPHCGYERWNGKRLSLIAREAALINCNIWGLMIGAETVDGFYPGLSTVSEQLLVESRSGGRYRAVVRFRMTLHSGSSVEVGCDHLEKEILE
jgi:hypothetical protein